MKRIMERMKKHDERYMTNMKIFNGEIKPKCKDTKAAVILKKIGNAK